MEFGILTDTLNENQGTILVYEKPQDNPARKFGLGFGSITDAYPLANCNLENAKKLQEKMKAKDYNEMLKKIVLSESKETIDFAEITLTKQKYH